MTIPSNHPKKSSLPAYRHSHLGMLWSRYFFVRFLKLSVLFIILSYTLFVMADMVGHMKDILDPKTSKKMWLAYYAAMFARRLDILVPFSSGIAATIVMTKAMQENVMIPLMCSGLSLKKFLSPFVMGALFFTFSIWSNYQWIYPRALPAHSLIIETDFGREKPKEKENRLGVVMLQNGERLFFNTYSHKKRLLKDVFWYISQDTICHIEELSYSPDETEVVGKGIEYFTRTPQGTFTKEKTILIDTIPSLHISQDQVQIATSSPKELSLSNLAMIVRSYGSSKTERATEAKIALYGKILSPLLSIFAVAISAILSLHFDRKRSLTLPLLGIISFLFIAHVTLQAANVLARSPFVPTAIVLLLPWVLFTYCTVRQLKRVLEE